MKVAILGGVAKKSDGILELGRDWDIWGINLCMPEWLGNAYVCIDKWFHLHRRVELDDEIPQHLEAFERWAQNHDEIEFVLIEPWVNLPQATIFPREVLQTMPRGNYHCGSFDWIVAYALYLGATEILLSGIRLQSESSEPISARACLEYWCGYAEAKGVRVTATPSCDLFCNFHLVKAHYVYGYDKWDLIEDRTAPPAKSFLGKLMQS